MTAKPRAGRRKAAPSEEPPSFAEALRMVLGITAIRDQLLEMETDMATAQEQLTDLKTAFTDFSSDVDAKLDQLLQAQGNLTPDAQAVFDDLKATLAEADARVGDADNSDTPTPEPVEPPPGV